MPSLYTINNKNGKTYNSIQENLATCCEDELNADMSSSLKGKPRTLVRGGCHKNLSGGEKMSVVYHSFFDYPMNFSDLIRWMPYKSLNIDIGMRPVVSKRGFSYLTGCEGLIYKRLLRKRISGKKIEIAKKASRILSLIPTVKMVAITGSLAMENASDESDIDLMIITKKGSLWVTRLFTYSLIRLFGLKTRKPNDNNQKDKLCLNMWLDESSLVWKERNIYTAHEIAQIVPLVNKNSVYERFLSKNKWILNYWPNSVKLQDTKILRYKDTRGNFLVSSIKYLISNPFEQLAYQLQKSYMKRKVTREIITPTRAIFHPYDWGKVVLERLK